MLATSLLVLEKKKITPITSTESNLSTNRNQNRNSSNLERASLRQKAKSWARVSSGASYGSFGAAQPGLPVQRMGRCLSPIASACHVPVVVQSLHHVLLFASPWTAARQVSLSFTIYWSLLKLMSTELVMPSNHFILCCPLLLLPSIFPSIRGFSKVTFHHGGAPDRKFFPYWTAVPYIQPAVCALWEDSSLFLWQQTGPSDWVEMFSSNFTLWATEAIIKEFPEAKWCSLSFTWSMKITSK